MLGQDQRCWTWTKANTICLSLTNYLPPCLFSRSARSGLYSYEIQSPQHCSHKFRNAVPAIPSADRPPRQTLTTLTPTPLGQQTSPVQITGWPPRTTGVIGIHALGFALSIDQNWGAYSAATSGAPTAFLALARSDNVECIGVVQPGGGIGACVLRGPHPLLDPLLPEFCELCQSNAQSYAPARACLSAFQELSTALEPPLHLLLRPGTHPRSAVS